MLVGIFAIVLAQASAGNVSAEGAVGIRLVTSPDWMRTPSAEDVAQVYPSAAQRTATSGQAVISCRISDLGLLQDCAVIGEDPPGENFGGAALALAKKFKMKPMTSEGMPVAGGTINIPIQFLMSASALPDLTITDPTLVDAVVTLNCRASPNGIVDNCQVVRERPSHSGAREMALAVGPKLKVGTAKVMHFQINLILKQGAAQPPQVVKPPPAPTVLNTQGGVLMGPRWIRKPTGEDINRLYPELARRAGASGNVTMSCKVTADGLLTECFVRYEDPTELGFGEATLKLADLFKMTPITPDGVLVAGGTVNIPMRWRIP